ncbi:MAG: hypothetical protein FWD66_08465 [Paludibacter sp.]|nr:hypothetical protein [Paludibacter sp.]
MKKELKTILCIEDIVLNDGELIQIRGGAAVNCGAGCGVGCGSNCGSNCTGCPEPKKTGGSSKPVLV